MRPMKFEYRIKKYRVKGGSLTEMKIELNEMEAQFNEMGGDGWELVTVSEANLDGGTSWVWATFKRPRE